MREQPVVDVQPGPVSGIFVAAGETAAAVPQHPALRLVYDAARIGQAWSRVASEHEHEAYELVREYTAGAQSDATEDPTERVVTALSRWQRQSSDAG